MANVKLEHSVDAFGVPFVRITKKKGDIRRWEVYEAMVKAELYGTYIMPLRITEDAPGELYDDEDEWGMYQPDAIIPELSEEQFGKGYEAAQNDYAPEAEWVEASGGFCCRSCWKPAPLHPITGKPWLSPRCPMCGACLNNGVTVDRR